MAQKTIEIPEIGEVILQKRKGSRSLRLTISHDGSVKVTMPYWSPYAAGETFARSKAGWIAQHKTVRKRHDFLPGERVGKAHRLRFEQYDKSGVTSRITKTEIIVRLPKDMVISSAVVQDAVHKAAIRALKQEGKQLLPGRLQELAHKHGFSYRSVAIKQLKTRWGSCSSQKDIVLNCYLMQLPWDLIDYVIMHELMHTQIMAHGPKFWDTLSQYVSNLSEKRKTMRQYQPTPRPQI